MSVHSKNKTTISPKRPSFDLIESKAIFSNYIFKQIKKTPTQTKTQSINISHKPEKKTRTHHRANERSRNRRGTSRAHNPPQIHPPHAHTHTHTSRKKAFRGAASRRLLGGRGFGMTFIIISARSLLE